jgi:hypothetical protein
MKLIVSILAGTLLVTLFIGFKSHFQKQSRKANVKCRYMAYACGECEPQYKIVEVIKGFDLNKQKLINKDIKVVFKSSSLESKIDSLTQKCAICYDFLFYGDLSYLPVKEYYEIKVDTCTVKLRDKTSCD